MIRKYTFTHSEKSKIYLTSDTHFRHSKLLYDRGFNTIEEHDETIINNWNNLVRSQDTVIHMGDFVLGAGDKSRQVCDELLDRLNGKIIMLFGNHLAGLNTIYKESVKNQFNLDSNIFEVYPTTYKDKITFVGNSILAHIKTPERCKQNHFVFMSHFAHRIWIDGNKEITHCNGHSHGSDIESNAEWQTTKRLDVGVDNFNFSPISFDRFLEIMDTKTHTILDHHSKDVNPSF